MAGECSVSSAIAADDESSLRFYAKSLVDGNDVFVRLVSDGEETSKMYLFVNCGDIMFAEQFISELKMNLQN